jgi:hypothetical protein
MVGTDISPMPAASWPNACVAFSSVENECSGAPDAASSFATCPLFHAIPPGCLRDGARGKEIDYGVCVLRLG